MPASARYGPKLNASPAFKPPAMRRSKTMVKANNDEINNTQGSDAQPNHAPRAASNLQSPLPIPWRPVINKKTRTEDYTSAFRSFPICDLLELGPINPTTAAKRRGRLAPDTGQS